MTSGRAQDRADVVLLHRVADHGRCRDRRGAARTACDRARPRRSRAMVGDRSPAVDASTCVSTTMRSQPTPSIELCHPGFTCSTADPAVRVPTGSARIAGSSSRVAHGGSRPRARSSTRVGVLIRGDVLSSDPAPRRDRPGVRPPQTSDPSSLRWLTCAGTPRSPADLDRLVDRRRTASPPRRGCGSRTARRTARSRLRERDDLVGRLHTSPARRPGRSTARRPPSAIASRTCVRIRVDLVRPWADAARSRASRRTRRGRRAPPRSPPAAALDPVQVGRRTNRPRQVQVRRCDADERRQLGGSGGSATARRRSCPRRASWTPGAAPSPSTAPPTARVRVRVHVDESRAQDRAAGVDPPRALGGERCSSGRTSTMSAALRHQDVVRGAPLRR